MPNGKYVYIGAKPNLKKYHPGGQSTASLGLIDFCLSNHIELEIIDSAQASFPLPSFSQRLRKSLFRQYSLISKLLFSTFDGAIIFCGEGFSFYEKTLSVLICRLFRLQSVLFIRSGHFMTECEHSNIRRNINAFLLRIPTKIAAQGSTWECFYRDMGVREKKLVIIRNWLSPERSIISTSKCISSTTNKPITFIFLGWLVKEKGVRELMEAVRSSAVLRTCRVIFAGDGNLYNELMEIKTGENLFNVELLGWQSPAQVDALLEESHVFVLPTYAEGFPNALLEALSKGLPIIITPVGAIPDSAKNRVNAIWVKPKDVHSLRMAMEEFVNKPELIHKYSLKSIEIANKNHNRDLNCKKLFNLFDKSPVFDD